MTDIQGECAPRFREVAETFERHFAQGREAGASLCIYQDGAPIVSLWGGLANPDLDIPWQEHTITGLASTSKALAATCAMLLVDRGELNLDAPVADYWPEFAQNGKERVLVRWLLAHKAGLPVLDQPMTIEDELLGEPVARAIAAQAPAWEPGTTHGYHVVTFGFAVGELVRRISGTALADFFRTEIAASLQLDVHIQVPDEARSRISPMVLPKPDEVGKAPRDPELAAFDAAIMDPGSLVFRAMFAVRTSAFDPAIEPRRLSVADASGASYGNAASLARLLASLIGEVDGLRLLRPETVEQARHQEASGIDEVLRFRTDWGMGFMLPGGAQWRSFGTRAFGHCGASGSLAFADPERNLAFAYVPNRWLGDNGQRARHLVEATYAAL